jgi:hypothetical protein
MFSHASSRRGGLRRGLAIASWCLMTLATAIPCSVAPVWAQTISGQISGTVTDSSKGVLPGVTITVTNERTQAARTTVTDVDGSWIVTNLPVGDYSVTAELQGFKRARRAGFALTSDGRLTADLALEVGGLSETVEVSAVVGETVNRTSGEVARTIDGDQVRDMALNGRNYMQLASIIPGAALLNDDSLDLTTSLSTAGQAINGARPNSTSLNIDGGNNLDSGSNGSQINNVGIDFIEEVKIQTSNFSAEYGRQSGSSVNVVTKSGANQFSGSAFEFFRHDGMDRANYFSPVGANGDKVKQRLRFHDYGGAIGGPIVKNRMFFFAGQEYKNIRRQTNPTQRSMPTTAELNGDFSLRLRGADNIVGTSDDGALRDPRLTGTCSAADRTACFPGNVIPSNRITPDGRAIANVYRAMIPIAASYNDAPVVNNATFQLDNPFDWRQDIIRMDYRFNDSQSVYVRYLHDVFDLVEPGGTFINSQLPTIPTNRLRPGWGYLAAHTWVVSSSLVHEVKVNASWNGQRIPPVGENWRRDTFNFQYPQLFDGGAYPDGIPNVNISGGMAQFRGPSAALLSPTTDIFIQDSVTLIRGEHSLKGGVKYTRNRKDQNGRTDYLGFIEFDTAGNPNSTTNGMADALLGNFRRYTEGSSDPMGHFRFNQYEAFASDNWRVKPNLSVELGVRYQYAPPIYTQANNVVNFDPALYDPAQAVRMNTNGTIVAGSGNRFNGLIVGGDGIPDDEAGRVNVITGGDFDRIPSGAERGLYAGEHLVMPRLSFAWTPDASGRTSVRGGLGVFYDRPEGNIIYSSLNIPPFTQISQYENGNLASPSGGTAAALAPLGTINVIAPDLKTARNLNFSLSMQRELWGGYFFEVAYIGSRGRNLLWFPEINNPTFQAWSDNAALPAAQRASVNAIRPFKGYSSIRQRRSEAESNYNGLQLYGTKRRGDITFTASYTFSKVNTNASGFGDDAEDMNLAYNYGPATYDRRHIAVFTYTYRVPFLRDRGGLLGSALGGWEVSGITRLQSGAFLTPTGNTSIGARRADYLGGDVALDDANELRWFNTGAFAVSPDNRRGNAPVGIIEAPGRHTWDLSFRKKFRIVGKTALGVQADVFNLFDRLNLNNPNVVFTDAAFGTINGAGPPRQVQIGLRFEF